MFQLTEEERAIAMSMISQGVDPITAVESVMKYRYDMEKEKADEDGSAKLYGDYKIDDMDQKSYRPNEKPVPELDNYMMRRD